MARARGGGGRGKRGGCGGKERGPKGVADQNKRRGWRQKERKPKPRRINEGGNIRLDPGQTILKKRGKTFHTTPKNTPQEKLGMGNTMGSFGLEKKTSVNEEQPKI